jgi:hypothetical protein
MVNFDHEIQMPHVIELLTFQNVTSLERSVAVKHRLIAICQSNVIHIMLHLRVILDTTSSQQKHLPRFILVCRWGFSKSIIDQLIASRPLAFAFSRSDSTQHDG